MGDAVAWKMMSALRVDLPGSAGPVGGGGGGGRHPPPPPPPPPPTAALSARPFLSGGVRTILIRILCWLGINTTWC